MSVTTSNGAKIHSADKPHLLVTYVGIDPDIYAHLARHFHMHTLCLPYDKHPIVAKQPPALPCLEGEGERDRSWQDWAPATTEQCVEYCTRVGPVDALMGTLVTPVTRELMDACQGRLRHVASVAVGYNHVDMAAAAERGVLVSNTPGVLDDTTADMVVGLMLATARRLTEAAQTVKDGTWTVWRHPWMCGKDVHGSTVGLVGFGRIAQRVARRLKAFDCRILYHGPREKPAEAAAVGAEFVSLDELLQRSDFVVPQCPLLPSTKFMFGEAQFERMRRDAVFINTTRGQVVRQEALVTALQKGWIAAAGLDVTDPEPLPLDSPLLALPNCVILPHIGSATTATRKRMLQTAADNLVHWSQGKLDAVHVVKG